MTTSSRGATCSTGVTTAAAAVLGAAAVLPRLALRIQRGAHIAALEGRIAQLEGVRFQSSVDLAGHQSAVEQEKVAVSRQLHDERVCTLAFAVLLLIILLVPLARKMLGGLCSLLGKDDELWATGVEEIQKIPDGNIYRLLALVGTELVGQGTYMVMAMRGLITLWMQIVIPYFMLSGILAKYHCLGIKHSVDLLHNWDVMICSILPLFGIAYLYLRQTHEQLSTEALLCHYQLSGTTSAGARNLLEDELEGCDAKVLPLDQYNFLYDGHGPPQVFWISASFVACIFSSMLLLAVMFLKVATYNGRALDLVVTVMALQWLGTLGAQSIRAHDEYRRMYIEQFEVQARVPEFRPAWVSEIKCIFKPMLGFSLIVGFCFSILSCWVAVSGAEKLSLGSHVGF